jgi:hypothetical protein
MSQPNFQFTCNFPQENFSELFTLRNRPIIHTFPVLQGVQLVSQNGQPIKIIFEYKQTEGEYNIWSTRIINGPPYTFLCKTSTNLQKDSEDGVFTELKTIFDTLNSCEMFHIVIYSQIMAAPEEYALATFP